MRLLLHPRVYSDISSIMEYYERVSTAELAKYRTLQSDKISTSLEGEALTMEVRSVQAVFEDGVLRPSEDLGLQEHERVRLIATSEAEWQRKFASLLEQVQSRTDRFATDEIEADITAATQEN